MAAARPMPAASPPDRSLKEAFDERLGSGAKTAKPLDLHNVGPSVQYKVRDKDGQAREYNNYMLPVDVDGRDDVPCRHAPESRTTRSAICAFPPTSGGTVKEWMHLRAALDDPAMRGAGGAPFRAALGAAASECRTAAATGRKRAARADPLCRCGHSAKLPNGQAIGGFQAIAGFIDTFGCPKASRKRLRACCCACSKARCGICGNCRARRPAEPDAQADEDASRFVQSSINAMSDSFFYGSPVYLQLDAFKQVQASVFQLTRAPGKKVVYLGSLLLVLGIFSMFYVRERRLWFWLKDTEQGTRCRDGNVERAQDARLRERIRPDARRSRCRVGREAHRCRPKQAPAAAQSAPQAHKIRPGKIMDLTHVSSSPSPSRPTNRSGARRSTSPSTTTGRF